MAKLEIESKIDIGSFGEVGELILFPKNYLIPRDYLLLPGSNFQVKNSVHTFYRHPIKDDLITTVQYSNRKILKRKNKGKIFCRKCIPIIIREEELKPFDSIPEGYEIIGAFEKSQNHFLVVRGNEKYELSPSICLSPDKRLLCQIEIESQSRSQREDNYNKLADLTWALINNLPSSLRMYAEPSAMTKFDWLINRDIKGKVCN